MWVGHLEVGSTILFGMKYVLQLEVTVDDALRVEVRDGEENLLHRTHRVTFLVDPTLD